MRKLSALLAGTGLAAALGCPSFAQEASAPKDTTKGAYVTVGVGGSWASSPSANYTEAGSVLGVPYTWTANGSLNLGGGVAAEAGIGYDFGNNIRGEISYVLNNYAIGDLPFSGSLNAAGRRYGFSGTVSPAGNVSTNSVMFSGYYDIPTKSKFTPYLGAGIVAGLQ
jgi:opacity protein-like surface antigen